MLAGSYEFIKWNDPMENIQYNNMQQKKSHNNNFKELIIWYKCSWKGHIKKNCLAFKFKRLHLKTKNMILCWEFNNIKFNNVKIFNMICTVFF